MTDTYDITDIRTGNGFDGKRAAVIFAADEAKPGSLESLTRFFHEHGYDAQIGYTGNDAKHVLRLHGLKSDRTLERLLKKDFPAWQEGQNIEQRGTAGFIRFPENMRFQPMEQSPARQKRSFMQKIKNSSTGLAAASYFAGNVGLVFSALYENSKSQDINWLKLSTPICYTMSSAFLYLLDKQRPEERSVHEIWEEISPQLLREDFVPTKAEEKQLREQGASVIRQAWNFMKNHPWEVSGLLNMIGAGAHATAAVKRNQTTEAMAALSTLTAMSLTMFVPKKGPTNTDLNARAFKPLHESISMQSLASADEQSGIFQPFFDTGHKIMDWIQEKPLRAASFLQLTANTGYGIAALTKKDDEGNRKTDWGLLATSGAYMTGNGFQTLASKSKGPSFDDAVTIAADAIHHQTDWQTQSPANLRKHVERIAHALEAQPELGYSQQVLSAGIMERLKRDEPNSPTQAEMINGFITTEKTALKDSPFISPHMVEYAVPTDTELNRY